MASETPIRTSTPRPRLPGAGEFSRAPAELMRGFSQFPTPDISDLLNRLYAVDPQIHCLTGEHHRVCGPACTVKVFPGDNLMVHKSLDMLEPGDVIVVDAGGSRMNAVLGDLISTKAKHRGVAGLRGRRPDPRSAETSRSSTSRSSPAARRRSARCTAAPARSTSRSAAAASW